MEWIDFVKPELLILVAFLWAVGLFMKSIPSFKREWLIPFILWGLSIIITVIFQAIEQGMGFTATTVLSGVIQGTFIAAAAVFGNEVIKQVTVKRLKDK